MTISPQYYTNYGWVAECRTDVLAEAVDKTVGLVGLIDVGRQGEEEVGVVEIELVREIFCLVPVEDGVSTL